MSIDSNKLLEFFVLDIPPDIIVELDNVPNKLAVGMIIKTIVMQQVGERIES